MTAHTLLPVITHELSLSPPGGGSERHEAAAELFAAGAATYDGGEDT